MNSTPRPRSFWFRLFVFLCWILALAVIGLGALCVYAFRDRSPGYTLDVRIPAPTDERDSDILHVGFARVKITPDLSAGRPVWLAGFSQGRAATAVHDDLWVMACVLDDGRTRLGIAVLDAIGFFHDDVVTVRQRLGAHLGFNYTIICTTHNHSTPDLMGLWGPNYVQTGVDAEYRERVISATARAFSDAVEQFTPARAAFFEIPVDPAELVTDTRKPEVHDPVLRVMHFTHLVDRTTLGTIVGWANHPETPWSRNTEITADFPGYLRDALENGVVHQGQVLDPGVGGTHLFVNGAIGGLITTAPNVTVRDPFLDRAFTEPSHEKARALGRNLAGRILPRLRQFSSEANYRVPLGIYARTVEVPISNKLFLLAPVLGVIDRGHPGLRRWNQLRTEVALVTLGDASIACVPGEIYPELVNGGVEPAPGADFGIQPVEVPPIRDLMPGKVKFLFGLANDEIGYIIPKSQWDEKPPYLYGSEKPVYGEINSVGPEAAGVLHAALSGLCRDALAPRSE